MTALQRIAHRIFPRTAITPGRLVPLAILVCCLSAVAVALVSQHVFDMQPCPWCVLQRVIFLAIAIVCGLLLIVRGRILHLLFYGLAFLFSVAGMATALWQHFKASNTLSCSLSLAERMISSLALDRVMPAVLAPRTSCADGAVDLLGIPYEFWSLALFVIIAGVLGARAVILCRHKHDRG